MASKFDRIVTVYTQSGEAREARHVSFTGALGRWVAVSTQYGPADLYCEREPGTDRWVIGGAVLAKAAK